MGSGASLAIFIAASIAGLVLVYLNRRDVVEEPLKPPEVVEPGQPPADVGEQTPEQPEAPPVEPEPQEKPVPLSAPALVEKLHLSEAEIARLIDVLRTADSFIEYDFTRRAGRTAEKLVHAGRPAWDKVLASLKSEEDEIVRSRLNGVLACMRWHFSPYFIFTLEPGFVEGLCTYDLPPKGEWLPSLETFAKAKDASKLIHSFTLNDPDASCYIFDFVEGLGAAALEPLLEAIADEHPYFHFCATVALMRIARRSLGSLVKLAVDEDAQIRSRAVWAVGLSGLSDAVPPLVRALEDGEAGIRSNAAFMLGMVPDRRAVQPLIKALKDPDEEVASYAAEALGVIGDQTALRPLQEYMASRRQDARRIGASALAGIGQQSAIVLLSLLRNGDEEARIAAASALSELRSPSTANGLVAALDDESAGVRAAAADALAYVGRRDVLQVLGGVLSDPEAAVRSSAAYALGRLGNPKAADMLGGLLEDEDARVRLAAVSALAKVKGSRALEILVASLESEELSPLAVSGIKRYGAEALPLLIKAFPGTSAPGKCIIARLLAEESAVEAVPILIDGLADRDIDVRFCSDKALKMITGHQTSYKCDDVDTKRAKGQEEWRTWWKKSRGRRPF